MQSTAGDYDLITAAQMRAAEAEAIAAGTTGAVLMERAGRRVADIIRARMTDAGLPSTVAVLCGPGNNGGDGYVIARILADRGWAVTVYGLAPVAELSGDALAMAQRWNGPVHPPRRFLEGAMPEGAIIVDALFGTGLARPVAGDAAAMIDRANGMGGYRLAVDIASGIGSDTGEVMGAAFEAELTVTFHARKPGHVLRPGARYCGKVTVADIGLVADATARARLATDGPEITLNNPAALLAPLGTDPDGHKYTKGHTLVLAGGVEGVGAARLAARAALRAGAGLVTLGVPAGALMAHAARGPDALMLRRCDGAEGLAAVLDDKRRNAVVIGPALGLGEATRAAVAAVLHSGRPVVLDADALTSFEDDAEQLADLTRNAGNAVLTPHSGEFARLFSSRRPQRPVKAVRKAVLASEINFANAGFSALSALHGALAAAAMCGAVIVLKGPATIIAAPDGRVAVNTNAPPWLGTAGSGDVLAGIIGGLLSQGLSPFDAARTGVWLHGEAGTAAGRGLIADDLPESLPKVLKRFHKDR